MSGDFPLVLEVRGVDDASVRATPVERTSPNGKQLYCAYDIDITKDGREWQPEPEQPAMVSMETPDIEDGQLLDIYHEGAEGLEFVATVASENGKIIFPAHSFSVYIVAEAQEYNRLKVILHQADGNEVTIFVKKLDLDSGESVYNRVVYNPGMGVPADGVNCMGWIAKANYDKGDIPNALTYGGVRDSIAHRITAGVTDGTVLHFYTMLFKHYSVTYLAENESVLHTDVMQFRADDDNHTMAYDVSAPYTPASSTQNFEGWQVYSHSDGENIDGHSDDSHNYSNTDEIGVTGNVTFRVNVTEGHWLIFHENGKGATYKAADFIRAGGVTVEPALEMTRNGYTFDGWWTGEPSIEGGTPTGSRFVFDQELGDNTDIYAKWNAKTTAGYSVIIWKQNINGDGYDFEELIPLTGNVGNAINTVSLQGTGNNAYARVNGTNKQYTGFHLDRFDQNVIVNTEGNAVLNVYYNRTEYKLTFQVYDYTYTPTTSNSGTQYGYYDGEYVRIYYNNGTWFRTRTGGWGYSYSNPYTGTRYTRSNSQSLQTIKTITALYEQDISTYFPIQGTNGVDYTGYVWTPQRSSIFTSGDVPSLDAMREENTTFRANQYGTRTTIHMYYYTEAIGATDVQYQGRYFDEHQHVQISSEGDITSTEAEDFIDILGYEHLTSKPDYSNGRVDLNSRNQYTIKFYYTRKFYTINFMNGAEYDGNGNSIRVDGATQIETVSDIAYGADISSYRERTPGSAPEGYVFEGWYADKTCTQPYDFTTMPFANITVYAKWRQIQYRVFLHPNVDPEDLSLNWGADNQAMNFRISYGGKVSAPTATRADYEFVGWFTDAEYTRAFNQDAVVLNETTVTAAYDKTNPDNYTDPMNKWGIIGDNPYNSDLTGNNGEDRFWITKKYDLYGKWRAILRGAIGIKVEYLANGGTNLPSDTSLYQDNVLALAGHACTPSDDTKEFSHWVLQHWNGAEFVDTDTRIYPGATYTVLKTDAKMHDAAWYNSNGEPYDGDFDITGVTAPDGTHIIFKATYTVKLRAEYDDKEKPDYTFIQWFRNDGTDAVRIDGEDTANPTLGINVAVAPQAPTREGYIFKGWYRSDESGATIGDCNPNFLHYHNGAFYKESAHTNVANYVAADNNSPIQYMYAIWEPIVDFNFESICQGAPVELPTTTIYNVDLSAAGWTWTASAGTVSGTSYTAPSVESVTLTFAPATSTCANPESFNISINTPNVPNASSYDYIWRGGTASHLSDWNTASNWYVYNSGYSIADAMPTSESKIFIGPAECITSNWPEINEAFAKDITIADGATLTVPAGKTLNIAGNLDIAASATFSVDNENSKVVFNGSSNQSVNKPVIFRDVTFAQNGVHTITIPEMMTVNGVATFDKGIVTGNATFNDNASVVFTEAARYNSYVSGKVTKKGDGSFTFPLGDNGVLGAFTTMIVGNTDKGVSIKFNHKRDNEGHGFSMEDDYPRWWNINDMCSENNPQLDHVSNYEYWKVVDISAATTLNTITLKVDASDQLDHFNHNFNGRDNENIYAVAHYDCWKSIGGPAEAMENGNQTITVKVESISYTRGGDFDGIITLGSTDNNTVLPIELTSFTATCDGKSALVEWSTATEKNNDYFVVERSDDAINFVEVGRVAGAGNSIEPLDYNFTDYGIHEGDNYYRLVQVDYDGTHTVSEIVLAVCAGGVEGEPEVYAYPNPFSGDLTVELDNFGNRPARIDVFDVLGRLVYTEDVDAPQNSYQTLLHLGGLSNSTYTVRVSTSDFILNRKVVKN